MRINRGQIQVFSISFLDVLSCALGAVIILFVVVPKSPATPEEEQNFLQRLQVINQSLKMENKSLKVELKSRPIPKKSVNVKHRAESLLKRSFFFTKFKIHRDNAHVALAPISPHKRRER